jgi:hypothetical protein
MVCSCSLELGPDLDLLSEFAFGQYISPTRIPSHGARHPRAIESVISRRVITIAIMSTAISYGELQVS